MAAVTDYADWKSLCQSGRQSIYSCAFPSANSLGNNTITSAWRIQNNSTASVAPGAAVACNNTTAGALLQNPRLPGALTNQLWLAEFEYGFGAVTSGGTAGNGLRSLGMLIDRLCHMSGLSGTSTSAQTVNSATLPRYTSGDGVMMAFEVYVNLGNTGTTATVSYTNQAGTSGRTSQPILVSGGAQQRDIDSFVVIPLQDGDTGVQSVQSITLAASTLTAGNFGITLFKPLAFMPMDTAAQVDRGSWRNLLFGGGVVETFGTSCHQMVIFNAPTNNGFVGMMGRVGLVEK